MSAPSIAFSGAFRRRPYLFVFGGLIAASAALMAYYRSGLSFMLDDWAFVIYRAEGNVGDYLDPHNEHISILPVAIYKLFLGVFGMSSAMPLHIASMVVFLLSVVILFLYMRPLVGEPAALIGCAVVLFLGAAWEDLLWSFQIGFSTSIASGIGALIMLNREDRFGDRMACLLLAVSMISTSMGIPFAFGALVGLLTQSRIGEVWRRLYVVAVPIALYAGWWLGWGHTAENGISLHNALNAPEYVFNAFRLALADLTGLFRIAGRKGALFTAVVALGAIGIATYSLITRRRLPRAFLVAAAIALAFWGLAALNAIPGRDYNASRYQFPGSVFVLMVLAGAFEGVRFRPRTLIGLAVIAVIAIGVNVFAMRDGYWNVFKPLSDKGIAGLTAIDIASGSVSRELAIGMNQDGTAFVTADGYLEAEERYGSVAWSESAIEEASPAARDRVDQVLAAALPIAGEPARGLGPAKTCKLVTAGTTGENGIPLPARTFSFRPRQDVMLGMGRYGDGVTGSVIAIGGTKTLVHVPADQSERPWRVGFIGAGPVRVCAGGVAAKPAP